LAYPFENNKLSCSCWARRFGADLRFHCRRAAQDGRFSHYPILFDLIPAVIMWGFAGFCAPISGQVYTCVQVVGKLAELTVIPAANFQ
jgi:hypothetical protein